MHNLEAQSMILQSFVSTNGCNTDYFKIVLENLSS